MSERCCVCGAGALAPHLAVAGSAGDPGLIPTTDRFGTALADIVRWTAARVETAEETCRAVWQWIARAYEVGDEPVRGLITVSGVEALPNPGEPGAAELRQMLSAELLTLDPWRP